MDIETFWDVTNGRGDWRMGENGQLLAEHDLKTAALISLFTWRRAKSDDVLPEKGMSRKGCWIDATSSQPMGSRLWLLQREKQETEVVERAKEYAEESLKWLVGDGVCEAVEVICEIVAQGVLGMHVIFTRDPNTTVKFQFEFAWANLKVIKG